MMKRTNVWVAGMCLALLAPLHAQDAAPSVASAQPVSSANQLIIYHAGSLTAAFKKIEAAFIDEHPGITILDKFGGSVDMARRVTIGGEPADIYASADYEDIDALLKPKWASYTIRFGQGSMVLVYNINDPNPLAKVNEIADLRTPFNPHSNPPSIPNVTPGWTSILSQPGVWIRGGDPGTDPGIYRGVLIMQLAEYYYRQPGLYLALSRNNTYRDGDKTPAPIADYRFAYEHSALTMARSDPSVRLARLPAKIAMSDPAQETFYHKASLLIPGLDKDDPHVAIHGSRVAWGITLLHSSKHPALATAFLQFLLTPDKGVALQKMTGPDPIVPAIVSEEDYSRLPAELRPLVTTTPTR